MQGFHCVINEETRIQINFLLLQIHGKFRLVSVQGFFLPNKGRNKKSNKFSCHVK